MADKFAPPTSEELAELKKTHNISAPPSEEELKSLEYSPLKAAGMGAINQLGLAPIVGGAALAAKDVASQEYSLKDFLERYRERRDVLKEKFKEAEEQSPKAYLAGNVAAGLALPVPGASAKGALTLGKALKSGALMGGVAGLASSPADLTKVLEEPEQLGTAAKDIATGATLGAGAGALGGALGRLATKAPEVQRSAESSALKALGVGEDITKKEYGLTQGVAGAESGYRKGVGRELLESGVLKPFSGAEATRQEIKPFLTKQAQVVNDIRNQAADNISNKQLNFKDFKDDIQAIKNDFARRLEGTTDGEERMAKIERVLDKQQQLYDFSKDDIKRLNDLKTNLEKDLTNRAFSRNVQELPEMQEVDLSLSRMLKNRIEDMAEQSQSGLGSQLKEANAKLSNYLDIATAATQKVSKDITKQVAEVGDYVALGFGLPTYIAKKGFEAQTGQSALDFAKKLQALGLQKTATTLAKPEVQTGLVAGGDIIGALGRAPTNLSGLSSEAPKESSTPLIYTQPEIMRHSARLSQSQDPKAQQVGAMLSNIANRPDREKNAMMFSLLENPAYRKYLKEEEAK